MAHPFRDLSLPFYNKKDPDLEMVLQRHMLAWASSRPWSTLTFTFSLLIRHFSLLLSCVFQFMLRIHTCTCVCAHTHTNSGNSRVERVQHLLLLRGPKLSAPTLSSSQLPVTQVSGDLVSSSRLWGHPHTCGAYTEKQSHTCTQK